MSVQIIKGFIRADQSNETKTNKAPINNNENTNGNVIPFAQSLRSDAAVISLSTRPSVLPTNTSQRLAGFRDAEKLADELSKRILEQGKESEGEFDGAHKSLGSVAGEKHLIGP